MEHVFITLVEPSGHEFTFLRDELMAFHKRIVLRTDPETEKAKHFTVTVLYFKNKAEFTLDVSPEEVRDALEEPVKSEEERYFAQLERSEKITAEQEPEVVATNDEEFLARLKEIDNNTRQELRARSTITSNWEWGNSFGSQTYLP